jgi:hypothetical protein
MILSILPMKPLKFVLRFYNDGLLCRQKRGSALGTLWYSRKLSCILQRGVVHMNPLLHHCCGSCVVLYRLVLCYWEPASCACLAWDIKPFDEQGVVK